MSEGTVKKHGRGVFFQKKGVVMVVLDEKKCGEGFCSMEKRGYRKKQMVKYGNLKAKKWT